MASRIEGRIMEHAIDLFANYGYFGVTTRDLAKKARVTEGSIYRLFGSKENLFEEAVRTVLHRSLDPAQILLIIFDQQATQDIAALTTTVLHRWYFSVSTAGARLLTQAYFVEAKWRKIAYGPIDKIIEIVTTVLERRQPKDTKLAAATTAKALMMALLHFKVTYASGCSEEEEASTVSGMIRHWLLGLQAAMG